MVMIRLFRTGTTNRPQYRIVAIEKRKQRQGRFLENLGTYDPRHGGGAQVDLAAVERWIERGARPSDTVASLIRRARAATPAASAS